MEYYSLNDYCLETFGKKLYRLALDGGFTCPNRDGTLGARGCIFCSRAGSGEFAASGTDIGAQIEAAKRLVADKRRDGDGYIAYFQSFTNTYSPVEKLRALFTPVVERDDIDVLAVATRPDCLEPDKIALLRELNAVKPVWVELGLQTTKEESVRFIRRGYGNEVYSDAMRRLKAAGLYTVTHMIVGLPGETPEDMKQTVRAIVAAGGNEDDVVQVCYGYGLFTGGAGLHGGAHRVGALTLPMSSGNTERQLQFMTDLKSTILCCTPSYAAYLGEAMRDAGISPEDNTLKAGIFGAEPWTQEMRLGIEKALGIKAYDIYGLTETSGPGVAFECEYQCGMHVHEDHFYPEIIDPDTLEVLPDGEKGELVFTSLDKEAFPLLRYRTRDICVLDRTPCKCGRTHVRMAKPMGRSDDMLIIRGVNVFPSQIETVLLKEGYAPNYRIEVDRVGNSDTFDVFVELLPSQFSDTVSGITAMERKLADRLRLMLGISPKVHLVAPGAVERSEGKAKRVIDRRKLHD